MPYEGPDGIGALLQGMTRFGWKPVIENGNTIALSNDARCSITLEPGGQFELSGAPLETVHQTCDEVHEHLRQVREVCDELGLGMFGLGFDPKWRREDIPWMPKQRYRIMRDYMPKKGRLGLDMMLRTCTVQTNLDYQSEADMVKKFRVSLALAAGGGGAVRQFAVLSRASRSGLLSQRSFVWTDTDPDRCGTLPFVFEHGFRVRALCRLHARRADVLRLSRRPLHRRERPVVPRFHGRQIAGLARRNPAPRRLDRPSDDGLSRGAAEDLSRNARRRWRPMAAAVRIAGAVGRDFL